MGKSCLSQQQYAEVKSVMCIFISKCENVILQNDVYGSIFCAKFKARVQGTSFNLLIFLLKIKELNAWYYVSPRVAATSQAAV